MSVSKRKDGKDSLCALLQIPYGTIKMELRLSTYAIPVFGAGHVASYAFHPDHWAVKARNQGSGIEFRGEGAQGLTQFSFFAMGPH